MTKLMHEKIIIPAWNMMKNDSKMKKFYMLPWLLSILFLTILLVYQSMYTYVVLFGSEKQALVMMLKFFHSDYVLEMAMSTIIFLMFYLLLIPMFEWWLMKYIHSKSNDKSMSMSEAFGQWLYKFAPIFEYDNIFSEFKLISMLNGYLFTMSFMWIEFMSKISYVFMMLFFLSMFLNMLLSYSKYMMVMENKWVFESMWISSKMTILNFKSTVKLYFLMFILNFSVIFNFMMFLSFPIMMMVAIWLMTTKMFLVVAITMLTILFVIFLFALWYLTAVLEVFKTAMWYNAYMEWKKMLDDD